MSKLDDLFVRTYKRFIKKLIQYIKETTPHLSGGKEWSLCLFIPII